MFDTDQLVKLWLDPQSYSDSRGGWLFAILAFLLAVVGNLYQFISGLRERRRRDDREDKTLKMFMDELRGQRQDHERQMQDARESYERHLTEITETHKDRIREERKLLDTLQKYSEKQFTLVYQMFLKLKGIDPDEHCEVE